MNLLCFDISSGGISGAIFDSQLATKQLVEVSWSLESGTLSTQAVLSAFKQVADGLKSTTLDAICIGTFMHNCVLLDEADQALTPIFTWLDNRGDDGVEIIRRAVGNRFHQATGCRYHPMFPIFKLAALRQSQPQLFARAKKIVSVKALLVHELTGAWIEDHGMASASGLLNVRTGDWDGELLKLVGIDPQQLPEIQDRGAIAGNAVPVLNGSGDGFFANIGTECEVPSKFAVTLGTSAVVRQIGNRAVLDDAAGTFCYRANPDTFLIGCAGSNGGNVLDWGRRLFGEVHSVAPSADLPVFIPLLHGERSPDWDPHRTGSWHGLKARHTAAELSSSILESVIFNLAHFTEILETASGETARDLILSGNGFLHPQAAPILAGLTGIATWKPKEPGVASLRGAGVCALRALGEPVPSLSLERVEPFENANTRARYETYRRLRSL